jgi:hypothetical protein
MLHVHSAGVPQDPHSGGEVDRAGPGLCMPAPAHTVWHEVSSYILIENINKMCRYCVFTNREKKVYNKNNKQYL